MSFDPISEHIVLIDAPFQGKLGVLGTYLIRGETSVIVDPGPTVSIPHIEKSLHGLGVSGENLLFIAPTHIHLDHSAGSWRLMQAYPKTRLLAHPRGSSHMKDPRKLEAAARSLFGDAVSDYGEIKGVPVQMVDESKDNGEIETANPRKVNRNDFLNALRKRKNSVSPEVVASFNEWAKQWDSN